MLIDIKIIRTVVQEKLKNNILTEKELKEFISELVVSMNAAVNDSEIDDLFNEMRAIHSVRMEVLGTVLSDKNSFHDTKWYNNTLLKNTTWFYRDRYRDFLSSSGFSNIVLNRMDEVTDSIIKNCGDPLSAHKFDRRGMVMGDVQAGKTSNYIALVNKAADLGYKVIIIIAGIHENLRSQTQERIDEGLIGSNSDFTTTDINLDKRVGVGREDFSRLPRSLTSKKLDFRLGRASIGFRLESNEPYVFVIKKNANILKHLITWLKKNNTHGDSGGINLPIMVIDDEADNASINVARFDNEISKINSQIRKLLNLFDKSSYIAYTATPFANIFINPENNNDVIDEYGFVAGKDLFPEHFLISLDRPDNYFGANKVFNLADNMHDPTRNIFDNDPYLPVKIPKFFRIEALPETLFVAVRAFLITGAIRILRGQDNKHHSMLVNVSHLTDIQHQVSNILKNHMSEIIIPALKAHCGLSLKDAQNNLEFRKFSDVFEAEYSHCKERWEDVYPLLFEVAERSRVYEVNSKSQDNLEYPDIKDVLNDQVSAIAVGGYSLSRGLTLEGLTISYFLRNSKAYDTLLQMARWFGYRNGYQDLCRVWMTKDSNSYYSFIAQATDELRDELAEMARNRNSPRDFGLRVRTHPNTLEITARSKAGKSETVTVEVGLGKSMIETRAIYDNNTENAKINRENALSFYNELKKTPCKLINETMLWDQVPVELIKYYLNNYINHPKSQLTNILPVLKYIENRVDENLQFWDVAFVGNSLKTASASKYLPIDLKLQERTPLSKENGLVVATRNRFSSMGITKLGLNEDELKLAKEKNRTIPDADVGYIEQRKKPLLAIHFLKLKDKDTIIDEAPLVAWTIAFPSTKKRNSFVTYTCNKTWLEQNVEDYEEILEALANDR